MSDRAGKTASALTAFQREYEAELQVAFDVLEQLGWPPGRLILSSGPISVDLDYEVIIKRGVELVHDLAVFRVKTKIGGGVLRYWCGWIVLPEDLPKPNKSTVETGRADESRWTRTELARGWVEDERPVSHLRVANSGGPETVKGIAIERSDGTRFWRRR